MTPEQQLRQKAEEIGVKYYKAWLEKQGVKNTEGIVLAPYSLDAIMEALSIQPVEKRVQAMKWWNDISFSDRAKYTEKYHPHGRTFGSLTGREIQEMYMVEVEMYRLAPSLTGMKWVKADEHLPTKEGEYLVYSDDYEYVCTAYWDGASFGDMDPVDQEFNLTEYGDTVSHWMPLPSAPDDSPQVDTQPTGLGSFNYGYSEQKQDELYQENQRLKQTIASLQAKQPTEDKDRVSDAQVIEYLRELGVEKDREIERLNKEVDFLNARTNCHIAELKNLRAELQQLKSTPSQVSDSLTPDSREEEKFHYCQSQIGDRERCETQCDHCKAYYAQIEDGRYSQEIEIEANRAFRAFDQMLPEGVDIASKISFIAGYKACLNSLTTKAKQDD